jgi:hypothetical protein
VTYAVEVGVNLFATPHEALAAAAEVPETVLEGLDYKSFEAPVILFSVGTHRIDKLVIDRAAYFLGEKAGVSPNLPAPGKTDAPLFNAQRSVKEEESILYGGYWYGTMKVLGPNIPLLLLDGLWF